MGYFVQENFYLKIQVWIDELLSISVQYIMLAYLGKNSTSTTDETDNNTMIVSNIKGQTSKNNSLENNFQQLLP